MLNREAITGLVPQKGAMCLLDSVENWSEDRILCRAETHLSAANPLRHSGRLGIFNGCEYGLQAAALHGALSAGGGAQRPGYLAALRVTRIGCAYLDDASIGALLVEAVMEAATASGLIYGFTLAAARGDVLLQGRGTIKLPDSIL